MTDEMLSRKEEALRESLSALGRVAVAFSAGVDSSLLLAVAQETLGDDVLAVTARMPSVPMREIEDGRLFCLERGICHVIVDARVFEIPGFVHNPPDRCYLCKRRILSCLRAAAHAEGFDVLVEGSNADDEGDFRPGKRAVEEAGLTSPLLAAGFSKADVRALAKSKGLAVWDKPAFACLTTRFAFGERITPERLNAVDEAEQWLSAQGFSQVRVRVRDANARIEVASGEIERLAKPEMRALAVAHLKQLGFSCVSVDLQGYRMGSMNEAPMQNGASFMHED